MTVAPGSIALGLFLLFFGLSLLLALPKILIAVLAFVAAALILIGK